MGCINYSVFDLLEIGPGPSSSHTIGPMRAGYNFLHTVRELPAKDLKRAERIQVRLMGSLAATGRGHKTDKAVMAGLLGYRPRTCPPGVLGGLLPRGEEVYSVDLGTNDISVSGADIVFDCAPCELAYSNTLVLSLLSGRETLFEREYHSVGGGFVHWEGKPEERHSAPRHCYENGVGLKRVLREKGISLHEMILENEEAITGADQEQIFRDLDTVLQVMENSVKRGLAAEGLLPGRLKLHRKAKALYQRAVNMENPAGQFTTSLCAYAFAASEENASGQPIVTAPTCGSAGVLPAVYQAMKYHLGFEYRAVREGLLAAAAVGMIVKHNASIAGADVGCQGEVGVASAMAAAMLTYAHTRDAEQTENAAESALEHHLGLTCDPVGGYVQIPCIERNAMAAVKAHAAYRIATTEMSHFHKVELDSVIEVMNETGRDMSPKYRETSTGGLAARVKCE
ncbi:MAG: L-serine ammonia-lyase [Desulfonatronovibrionaceae bacterium]